MGRVGAELQVEETFLGASDWMLRTSTGIYRLGLGLGPGQVKWGDRDNTIVAATFLGGRDMRFQAYRILRPEGSRAVPLTGRPEDPGTTVALEPLGSPVTLGAPAPIDLGTTIHDTRIVSYSQQLVTVSGQFSYSFDQALNDWVQSSATWGPTTLSVPYEHQFVYAPGPVPVAMNLADQDNPVYFWTLRDFFLDRNGDVIGLVAVNIATPPGEPVSIFRHNSNGEVVPATPSAISYGSLLPDLLYFIVNLTQRSVIGKSCQDTVTILFDTPNHVLTVDLNYTVDGTDQPTGSTPAWRPVFLAGNPQGSQPDPVLITVNAHSGIDVLDISGFYRPDLVAAGFQDAHFTEQTLSGRPSVADPFSHRSVNGGALGGPSIGRAIETVTVNTDADPFPRMLYDIRRSNGPAEEYTILGWNLLLDSQRWLPFRWNARTPGVQALPELVDTRTLETFDVTLLGANRMGAMFAELRFDAATFELGYRTHLVLPATDTRFFDDRGFQYQFLAPNQLLGVDDLRFHTIGPSLATLPGPRPLASGGVAFGEYHLVGRRLP
jgi:hypothetical protein